MTKPSKKIVTIGGGMMKTGGLLAIDQEIIRLTNKKNPRLLFLPTATSDSELYWHHINNHFGKKLGCETEVLYVIKENPTPQEITEKILNTDIIYVGGGNTLKMMRRWRKLGIDTLLKKAWEKGTVLCGISAGSICWYESGHSDSLSFYNPKKWKYINVTGLGFLKGIHCPHFNSATLGIPRKKHFYDMMKKIGGHGLAIDNNCAIEYLDNTFRVITSQKNANAYRVFKKNNTVHTEKIPQTEEFMSIELLYST